MLYKKKKNIKLTIKYTDLCGTCHLPILQHKYQVFKIQTPLNNIYYELADFLQLAHKFLGTWLCIRTIYQGAIYAIFMFQTEDWFRRSWEIHHI